MNYMPEHHKFGVYVVSLLQNIYQLTLPHGHVNTVYASHGRYHTRDKLFKCALSRHYH